MDKKYIVGCIEEIFQIDDEDNELFIKKLRDTIFNYFNPNREYNYYDKLPHFSKMVIALYSFYIGLEIEAFGPLLLGSSGNFSEDIKFFLKEIKAYKAYKIMQQISSFFPENRIPVDEMARSEIIYELEESVTDFDFFDNQTIIYYEDKDDIPNLLKSFLKTKMTQFINELKSYHPNNIISEKQIKKYLIEAEKEADLIKIKLK